MTEKSSHRDWKSLGAAMTPTWSEQRASTLKRRIEVHQKEQKWRRITGAAVLCVVLSAGGALALFLRAPERVEGVADAASELETLHPLVAAPPSREPVVQALTPGTRFNVEEGVSKRSYNLIAGTVRVETSEGDPKPMVVRVGSLVIEDIGTVFTVEALPEERARVRVPEGRVRVSWPTGHRVLMADEQGEFPPRPGASGDEEEGKTARASVERLAPEDWRSLARRGRYQQAFKMLERDPSKVLNRVDDLLLAADVMRLSGRPKRAVGFLERVLTSHRRDPRADLAAFTLGRVYLDELGRPLQAAKAFRTAGRGSSPLAEESLAREVEAWSRAGELERARQAAVQYVRKYPKGARVEVVRAFGGLNAP
jgi:hypothetical protein